MRVLVVNPGSSSVKLGVVEDGVAVATVPVDSPSVDCARGPLIGLAGRYGPVDAVGVRFVHGGDRAAPELVTAAEQSRLAGLTPLAPLHQPLSVALAGLARDVVAAPVVACFDTAFHARMPEYAVRYALPRDWVRRFGLRRYGDLREVLAARTAGDADAWLGVEVYLHRLRREIGAMAGSLDRVDAVVFTGGVAEHQSDLVAALVRRLPVFGLSVDEELLAGCGDRVISPPGAATRVVVVAAREDLEIARQTTDVVRGRTS